MKKGQIAVFIIAGIAIVFIVALAFYFPGKATLKGHYESFPEVAHFIDSCVEQTAINAVVQISREGGYYDNDEISIFFPPVWGENIPLYVSPDSHNVPEMETIEASMRDFFELNLPVCTDGFSGFREQGIAVLEGEPKAEVSVLPSQVLFKVNYKVIIQKESKVQEVSDFSVTVNAETFQLFEAARKFAEIQKQNPESLALSALAAVASEGKIYFSLANYETVDVITLVKNDSALGEPYEFSFAVGYSEKLLEREE